MTLDTGALGLVMVLQGSTESVSGCRRGGEGRGGEGRGGEGRGGEGRGGEGRGGEGRGGEGRGGTAFKQNTKQCYCIHSN